MNEILKAIAADPSVSAEFRAALPVGHTQELVAALERAADTFADLRIYFKMLGKETQPWELAEADARAAIAKATT